MAANFCFTPRTSVFATNELKVLNASHWKYKYFSQVHLQHTGFHLTKENKIPS